jgi:hypothetical protein
MCSTVFVLWRAHMKRNVSAIYQGVRKSTEHGMVQDQHAHLVNCPHHLGGNFHHIHLAFFGIGG